MPKSVADKSRKQRRPILHGFTTPWPPIGLILNSMTCHRKYQGQTLQGLSLLSDKNQPLFGGFHRQLDHPGLPAIAWIRCRLHALVIDVDHLDVTVVV